MNMNYAISCLFIICLALASCGDQSSPIVLEEFIYDTLTAKTPQCHASTVAASGDYLIAAWFGGTHEKNKDVGIWVSRKSGDAWSEPLEVVNGIQNDTLRYPCWNPVLFQPKEGPLVLFYKVGPSPREWWGRKIISHDNGNTWTEDAALPEGFLGPIKNKPVELADGSVMYPTSTEHDGWKVQMEFSNAGFTEWRKTGDLNDGKEIGAIQPTILFHPDGVIQALCRTQQGFVSDLWSEDNGKTWGEMGRSILPNPNSGIDAVTLKDGRHLLVYNPVADNWGARVPLTVSVSDNGSDWTDVLELEPLPHGADPEKLEFSYPAVVQTDDGKVHIVYTWNRKTVKYVVLDPSQIKGGS